MIAVRGMCKTACVLFSFLSLASFPAPVAAQATVAQPGSPLKISALRTKAAAGDSLAQFQLAEALESGHGVAQDYIEAASWYQKAANAGNAAAQNNLGAMYALGRGVPRDAKEAFRWYLRAAAEGLAPAQNNVGYLCFTGSRWGMPPQTSQRNISTLLRAATSCTRFAATNHSPLKLPFTVPNSAGSDSTHSAMRPK